MDKDRTIGAAAQVEGSVKQAIGKLTGNAAVEAEGTAPTSTGRTRKTLGLANGQIRAASKDHE